MSRFKEVCSIANVAPSAVTVSIVSHRSPKKFCKIVSI